jgi:hypothetical protein
MFLNSYRERTIMYFSPCCFACKPNYLHLHTSVKDEDETNVPQSISAIDFQSPWTNLSSLLDRHCVIITSMPERTTVTAAPNFAWTRSSERNIHFKVIHCSKRPAGKSLTLNPPITLWVSLEPPTLTDNALSLPLLGCLFRPTKEV